MSIFLTTLERRLSQFAFISTNFSGKNQITKLAGMYDQLPRPYKNCETHERKIFSVNAILQKSPWQLPSKQREMVFTFPSTNRQPIVVPGIFVNEFLKKFDPLYSLQIPLWLPQQSQAVEILAGERMLKIRRHKMRKHKRRKRFDRDYFKYQKYHRQKKAKAETFFRNRMQKMLEDYKTFDAEKYIKDVIACAKQDVTKDVSLSGRRKYPHWSTLITLEELYGLPQTDYIVKEAGLAGEEDRDKIKQLKKEYDLKYRGFLNSTSCFRGKQQEKQDSFDVASEIQEKKADGSKNSEKTLTVGETENGDIKS
ncbi:unnamed protein product [Litomosoides sigmodontis]|uniref:Mitochondrial mRNA-processing protein COX24 C-terminal domain-containing protein n=1 Tax=Litomosoides sigmodontis TaxID=42156 RepID=A0A3P6TGV8_LITSI|nr:unnamed protein product [Litomosoides sigmodontis]